MSGVPGVSGRTPLLKASRFLSQSWYFQTFTDATRSVRSVTHQQEVLLPFDGIPAYGWMDHQSIISEPLKSDGFFSPYSRYSCLPITCWFCHPLTSLVSGLGLITKGWNWKWAWKRRRFHKGVGNDSLTCFDDRVDEDARKINTESTSQRFFPTFN